MSHACLSLRFLFASCALICLLLLVCAAVGCNDATNAGNSSDDPFVGIKSDEELRRQLDEVLGFTFTRRLNTKDHAAWQILHGALAYQRQFQVLHNEQMVSAVDHILNGGQMSGWTVERGNEYEPGRYGLRAILEPGSKTGQGHPDQWLAILAQCPLSADQTIVAQGHTYTVEDYVRQVQHDVYRNGMQEYSWTLIGLTSYLPTDAQWTAGDGTSWSIAKLVEIEAEHPVGDGACGGTHRLIGLSMALNQHLSQHDRLEGPWQLAEERVQAAIEQARKNQNPDGSFTSNYLLRGETTPDLAQNLGTTGHVVEFLALALSDDQLREPWVQRAVVYLCGLLRKTRSIDLECGVLYHAAHGLVLYRQRVFGHQSFLAPDPATTETASN